MFLHLGADIIANDKEILGIFDLDTTTVMKASREYLAQAEKTGRVVNVSYELPKSFVICTEPDKNYRVYISQLAPATLRKRSQQGHGF